MKFKYILIDMWLALKTNRKWNQKYANITNLYVCNVYKGFLLEFDLFCYYYY